MRLVESLSAGVSPVTRTGAVVIIGCLCLGIGTNADPQNKPETGVTVSGRVIEGIGGLPLADSVVTLVSAAIVNSRVAADKAIQVRTNSQGSFKFVDVPLGVYKLESTAAAYLRGSHGQVAPLGASLPLTISSGTPPPPIVIRMWQSSTLSGTLQDERREPVVSADIRAFRWETVAGRRRLVSRGRAITDAKGHYQIEGLVPGDYVVWIPSVQLSAATPRGLRRVRTNPVVLASLSPLHVAGEQTVSGVNIMSLGAPAARPRADGRLDVYAPLFWPQARAPVSSVNVILASGETRSGINFELRPIPGVRVSGRVVAARGTTEGLVVRLAPEGYGEFRDDSTFETAVAEVAPDGSFVFAGVVPGSYVLRAEKEAYPNFPSGTVASGRVVDGVHVISLTTRGGDEVSIPLPTEPLMWGSSTVGVGKEDISALALVVQEGFTMSGRVEAEGQGTKPKFEEVQVSLEPASGGQARPLSAVGRGIVDKTGTIRTAAIPPGSYVIRLPRLPNGWTVKSISLSSRDITEKPVQIDRDHRDLVVSLTDRPNQISGRVVLPDGRDGSPVSLVLFPTNSQMWRDYGSNPRRVRGVRVATDGSFRLEALPLGEYFMAAIDESEVDDWKDEGILRLISLRADRITIEESTRATKTLSLIPISGARKRFGQR